MRDLGDEYRMSFRSCDEAHAAFRTIERLALGDRGIRFRAGRRPTRRRPTRAAIFNALLLGLAERPDDELRRVLLEGMERLNGLLAHEDAHTLIPQDAAGVLVQAEDDEDTPAAAG